MNTQLLQWLITTGLDEQRAQVYLATLSLGEATAKEIADTVGLGRTAVYDNLRVLEQRGYMHTLHEGKRKIFVPLHPKELYKKFDQQKQQLKDLLPDFLALYAEEGKQPFVQMFTGTHAAREVFEDILAVTKKEYCYLSPQNLTYSMVDKAYMKTWVARRVKKGIQSKSLRVKGRDVRGEAIFMEEEKYLRQIRYLPAYVDLKSSIYIYENNIAVISTKKESAAFIIYSPDLAFSFRHIFDFLWNVSMKS
ncbi:MAG: TrmB family transcriptional regulator [Candidatus Kerfeldbacteria bacterium]|nr:TrmB family transcriptional regulator [Candidatus Kerfeldbacteria bacterium]